MLLGITEQFTDKQIHGHWSVKLLIVNSRTSQLAEMFYLKFAVNNRYKMWSAADYATEHFQFAIRL